MDENQEMSERTVTKDSRKITEYIHHDMGSHDEILKSKQIPQIKPTFLSLFNSFYLVCFGFKCSTWVKPLVFRVYLVFVKNFYLFLSHMCVLAHLPWLVCEGQRITCKSWFSHHRIDPGDWTQVIRFGCKHLSFICWASSLAQAYSFELRNSTVEKIKIKYVYLI